jgi:hypothetical protein
VRGQTSDDFLATGCPSADRYFPVIVNAGVAVERFITGPVQSALGTAFPFAGNFQIG